jgi:hypothetical protein
MLAPISYAPNEAFWGLEVEIKPGKLEDFLSVARDLMDTMDEEPGTLDLRILFECGQDRLPHPRASPRFRRLNY